MTDKEKIIKLRTVLLVLLDQVDYTQGACTLSEPVGGVLSRKILSLAHKILEETRTVVEVQHADMSNM